MGNPTVNSYRLAISVTSAFCFCSSLIVAHEPNRPGPLVEAAAAPASSFQGDYLRATPCQPVSNVVEAMDFSGLDASARDNCEGKGDCGCCTCEQIKAANEKAANAYKGVYYANDFSYLNDPCYQGHFLGDRLKQLNMPHCGKLDIGGQIRLRYHHELGMKGQRFRAGTDDDFLLTRLRLFGNYKVNDRLRFYVEGFYADSSGESLPPRGTDENFMDFQNLLVDVQLTDDLLLRVGRQELLYGAQRTVSPLDWANTRRTFEGVKAVYKSGDWQIDGFFTHFVPILSNDLDEADYDLPFYGMYGVYSGLGNSTVDVYYLGFDDNSIGQSLHTMGSRLNGKDPCTNWLWEIEGAVQFGKRSRGVDQDGEGFVTAGIGRAMPNVMWKPTIWVYFDYASENYNQLFPLAHKYLGFIDAVQRQNVQSPNVLLTMTPRQDWTLLLWAYHFQSSSAAPVPAIGGTPPQNASRYLGNELDLILAYQFNPRADILFGYSHFWRGSKIDNPQDADFFYTQFQMNF